MLWINYSDLCTPPALIVPIEIYTSIIGTLFCPYSIWYTARTIILYRNSDFTTAIKINFGNLEIWISWQNFY